jgi:hypothetical protein
MTPARQGPPTDLQAGPCVKVDARQETPAPDAPPPVKAPSRASMAAMVFSQVKKRLEKVKGFIAEVEREIWKTED